jgi:hypothetical protein
VVLAAHSVDNRQLAIINGTESDDTGFAIIPASIGPFQNRTIEDPNGICEVDSMLGYVGRVLRGVPIERHLYRRSVLTFHTAGNSAPCGFFPTWTFLENGESRCTRYLS